MLIEDLQGLGLRSLHPRPDPVEVPTIYREELRGGALGLNSAKDSLVDDLTVLGIVSLTLPREGIVMVVINLYLLL